MSDHPTLTDFWWLLFALVWYVTGLPMWALGVLGLVLYFAEQRRTREKQERMRDCPHCAESIQAAAKICKHCGLASEAPKPPLKPIPPGRQR